MHRSFFLMTFSFLEGSKWERKFQHLVTTSTKPRRPHKYKNKSRQRRMKKQGKRMYAHEQTWKKKMSPNIIPILRWSPVLLTCMGYTLSLSVRQFLLEYYIRTRRRVRGNVLQGRLWRVERWHRVVSIAECLVCHFFQVKRLYLNIWSGCATGTYSFRVSVVPLCHCCYFSSCSRPSTAEDGSSSNKSFPVELSWLNTYTNE